MSVATDANWMPVSSRSLCRRLASRARSWINTLRYRVRSRSSRIGAGGTKLPRNRPCSSNCAIHTQSWTSGFRPGTCLTRAALTSRHVNASSSTAQNGLPVHPRALHRHVGYPMRFQPIPQGHEIRDRRAEDPDMLLALSQRPGHADNAATVCLWTSSPHPRSITCSIPPPPPVMSPAPGGASFVSNVLGVLGGNNAGYQELPRHTIRGLAIPIRARRSQAFGARPG
jgi:hypothetical protein